MIDFKLNTTVARCCVLFVPWLLTLLWLKLSHPPRWRVIGAQLSFLWQLPFLFLLHHFAVRLGLWSFQGKRMLFLSVPIDFALGWAALWGGFCVLAFHRLAIKWVILIAFLFDLIVMHLLNPFVQLGEYWLLGEAALLTLVLLPALLLARWTEHRVYLGARVTLITLGYAGLFLFLIPANLLAPSGGDFFSIFGLSIFETIVALLLLTPPIVLGLISIYEFAIKGQGTPLPFDPPRKLVITGPYAYVSNPMQLATLSIYIVMACIYSNFTLLLIPLSLWIFSIGFNRLHEKEELSHRFGKSWLSYKRKVPAWIPRWHPYIPGKRTLNLSNGKLSSLLMNWLKYQECSNLQITTSPESSDSATHYIHGNDSKEYGIHAMARGLEHIHFLYAWIGWLVRLPVVCFLTEHLLLLLAPRLLAIQRRSSYSRYSSKPSTKLNVFEDAKEID